MAGMVLTRRGALLATMGVLAAPALTRAADPIRLRCSLDTAPSHPRNKAVTDYLNKVEEALQGAVKPELFQSGQLYPDLQVARALLQGEVDMAVPGAWTLTGLVSDFDFGQLPILYGQPIELLHRASDGGVGAHLTRQIEAKLRTHVLGRFTDLGYQNWYTTGRAIHRLADLKGMKIRSPGGAGIAWRIRYVEAIPNTTAWPNVPLALSQGTFDGFVSTDESCTTAQLWEAGVKHSYADHQFAGQYVPMLSGAFWAKLNDAQRKTMKDFWAANIDAYRAAAMASQQAARGTMESKGVMFVDPSPQQLAADRRGMIAKQDELIRDAKLSPELVRLVTEAVGSAA
ncbi:MAG TPA: TRAP transporter substrate-binding protein DctP [Crenalkalicoccus sp.]|nr:TRAP transporter substrate-binding protein DctP [Crenalkalicoccus sp.]